MVRILEKLDCKVHYNTDQTCCGMAAYNAGLWDQAKEVGEKFITEFHRDRPAVAIGGACTGMVRNSYSNLFHNSVVHNQCKQLQRNLSEFTEFLNARADLSRLNLKLEAKVAWMDACQAMRECKIREAPRKILDQVHGLEWVELADQETCCGFGGLFSIRSEAESVEMGTRKLEAALEAGVQYLVTTDSSCMLHLDGIISKRNLPIKTLHIIDLLALSMD